MKNFINFRVKGINNSKIISNLRDNLKLDKSWSDKDEKRLNYQINFNDVEWSRAYKFGSKYKSKNQRAYRKLFQQYRQEREKHNEFYKLNAPAKNRRNLKDSKSSWAEAVFTFSEAIKHDLGTKYTENELHTVAVAATIRLEKEYGFELKAMFFHTQETTEHYHMYFKNFDKKGNTLTYLYREEESFSKMQDIVAQEFAKLGMKRGIKKSKSLKDKNDYNSIQKYHQNLINNLKNERQKYIHEEDELKALKKELQLEYKHNSDEVQKINSLLKMKRESIKLMQSEIKALKDELQSKKTTIKQHKNTISMQEHKLDELLAIIEKNIIEKVRGEMIQKFG